MRWTQCLRASEAVSSSATAVLRQQKAERLAQVLREASAAKPSSELPKANTIAGHKSAAEWSSARKTSLYTPQPVLSAAALYRQRRQGGETILVNLNEAAAVVETVSTKSAVRASRSSSQVTFSIILSGLVGVGAWLVLHKTPIQSLEAQTLAAENIAKLGTSFVALTARRLPAEIVAPVFCEEPPIAQVPAQEEAPAAPVAEAGVQRKPWGAWAWSAWLGTGGGARATPL
jgi:hypothetical protein